MDHDPNMYSLTYKIIKRNWQRLLFFSSCLAIGIAFLFSVGNLLEIVTGKIAEHARQLLAGDIEVASYRKFTPHSKKVLHKLKEKGIMLSKEITFASMLIPATKDITAFLVSVKAVDQHYPLYGTLKTSPQSSFNAKALKNHCYIDQTIALQYGLGVGDQVKLGKLELIVAALIEKEPGRVFSAVSIAPRVIIPISIAYKTGLIQFGSRIRRSYLLALPQGKKTLEELTNLRQYLDKSLTQPHLRLTMYTDTQNSVRELFQRQGMFFFLISIVTLLVGAIGMAASITTFLNEQLETVGTLRCLGVSPQSIFFLYLRICMLIGIVAAVVGCLLGTLLSSFGLKSFVGFFKLNVHIPFSFHWQYFAEGIVLSCLLTVGINIYKIYSLSQISPMEILRGKVTRISSRPWINLLLLIAFLSALFFYTQYKTNSWRVAMFFTVSVVATIATAIVWILLFLKLFAWLLNLSHQISFSLSLRLGILQLVREKSQTLLFLLSLTIGFCLIQTLNIVYHSFEKQVFFNQSQNAANIFIADVRKKQMAKVQQIAAKYAKKIDFLPRIRARMTHINGKRLHKSKKQNMSIEQRSKERLRQREFNLTYKDTLDNSETLVAGKFWAPGEKEVKISLEKGFARRSEIQLGHSITFDIQGRLISGVVTSIRKIDWLSMKPNFFVVMPASVLKEFPQTIIASLKINSNKEIAAFKKELASSFSNIFVINTTRIMSTVQTLLHYFLTALQITAWFCIFVGILILVGTFSMGHKERIDRVALFRTLGCDRKTILSIEFVEFLCIGMLAAIMVGVLSYVLSFFITQRMSIEMYWSRERFFEVILVVLLPLIVGFIVNWKIYGASVMENLRK